MEYIRVCFTLVVYLTCKDSASFAPWQGVGGGGGGLFIKRPSTRGLRRSNISHCLHFNELFQSPNKLEFETSASKVLISKTKLTANSLCYSRAKAQVALAGWGPGRHQSHCSSLPHGCPPAPTVSSRSPCTGFQATRPSPARGAPGLLWRQGRGRLPAQREAHRVLVVGGHHHFGVGVVLQLLQDVIEAPGGGHMSLGLECPPQQ